MSQVRVRRVRWQNLLSYGNSWTEIDLEAARTTLIIGPNGAGKSTFLDAVSFALFGKPFRKVSKGQLVNTVTNRDLLVECEFAVNGREYLVRRGHKPSVFELYRSGELVPMPADVRDHQARLERDVLRMSHRTFTQVVVLGSATFVPFMQLPAHARREVVEDLLDIGVFSTMNVLLRERVDECDRRLGGAESELRVVEVRIEETRKHAASSREELLEMARERVLRADETDADVEFMADVAEGLNKKKTNVIARMTRSRVDGELTRVRSEILDAEAKLRFLQQHASFIQKNAECPKCGQDIDARHRDRVAGTTGQEINELEETRSSLASRERELRKIVLNNETALAEVHELDEQIKRMAAEARVKMRNSSSLREEAARLEERARSDADSGVLQELQRECGVLTERRDQALRDQSVLTVASRLLRDGGVKARVVRQYMPMLNALIAKYLAALDFFVSFELDEGFKETIRSRYRDEFSYDSFSQGEKLRLDLAILFAWRAVARVRTSASVNVLLLDEILDGSLDAAGAEEFMKVISALTEGERVFVISHRGDQLTDKFERTLRFEKVKNFSQMETAA